MSLLVFFQTCRLAMIYGYFLHQDETFLVDIFIYLLISFKFINLILDNVSVGLLSFPDTCLISQVNSLMKDKYLCDFSVVDLIANRYTILFIFYSSPAPIAISDASADILVSTFDFG